MAWPISASASSLYQDLGELLGSGSQLNELQLDHIRGKGQAPAEGIEAQEVGVILWDEQGGGRPRPSAQQHGEGNRLVLIRR